MTDAALSVTQSVVEQFAERYLNTLGCDIDKQDGRWSVIVPEGAETDIASGQLTLVCSTDPDEVGDEKALHPESPFFHALLEEASERSPTGRVSVTAADTEILLPSWIVQSEVSLEDAEFIPYYDRTALVALFKLSVETVSEYQTELLRAVAVDTRSDEILPELSDTLLSRTLPGQEPIQCGPTQTGPDAAKQLVKHIRATVVEDIQPKIDEVHEAASRSADAELEEYRRLQQQRIEELAETRTSLVNRIDELSESIEESDSRDCRTEALKERRELKAELEEVASKLESHRNRREQGFPEKQREIRERHALEVVATPVTLTEIQYERGEVDFTLANQTVTRTLTVGYGSGVGVTETIECERCGAPLSEANPVRLAERAIRCESCDTPYSIR